MTHSATVCFFPEEREKFNPSLGCTLLLILWCICFAASIANRQWSVYGPVYGGQQGIGGAEAYVYETNGFITQNINNCFGDTVGMAYTPTGMTGAIAMESYGLTLGGYGPQPGTGLYSDLIPQWRGRYVDWTGYIMMGARYYEARSGRFLSPDPLDHAASMSLYDYCNGDPVNGIDPDGRCGGSSLTNYSAWTGASSSSTPSYYSSLNTNQAADLYLAERMVASPDSWMAGQQVAWDAQKDRNLATGDAGYQALYAAADVGDFIVDFGKEALAQLPLLAITEIGGPLLGGLSRAAEAGLEASSAAARAGVNIAERGVVETAAKGVISNPGANGFVLVGEGSLHSTVAVRQGSMVNRVFDSGFATNPAAAQPLGRYFGEGGVLPSSAGGAITSRGLNLPGIINDAQMGAVYRANTNIPALRGPAAGGTGPELIIDPSYFRNLELQGGYNTIAP